MIAQKQMVDDPLIAIRSKGSFASAPKAPCGGMKAWHPRPRRFFMNILMAALLSIVLLSPTVALGSASPDEQLQKAAATGKVSGVLKCLEKGARIEAKNALGMTALMTASQAGHAAVVRALLEKGAQVDAQNNDGPTALFFAAGHGHLDVLQVLLSKKADVNIRNRPAGGMTPLIIAASVGHTAVMEFLIKNGAELNAKMSDGGTALSVAIKARQASAVNVLRQNGASENETDTEDEKDIREAIAAPKADTLPLLVLFWADNELSKMAKPAVDAISALMDKATPLTREEYKAFKHKAEVGNERLVRPVYSVNNPNEPISVSAIYSGDMYDNETKVTGRRKSSVFSYPRIDTEVIYVVERKAGAEDTTLEWCVNFRGRCAKRKG
jgi:hypothetical protein